jgi:tetratricopeptide (TPR) repeat protein
MFSRILHWGVIGLWVLSCKPCSAAGEEVWTEVRSPNFIVVGNGSAKEVRSTAVKFEQFRSVIQMVFPKLKMETASPLVVFAAGDEQTFRDLFTQDKLRNIPTLPAGFFQPGSEESFVVLRTDIRGDQEFHAICHEYVHMLMRLNFRKLPLWLSEGLAEFLGHATISDRNSEVGGPGPEQMNLLSQGQMLRLATLMSVDRDSPWFREESKIQVFYAQCWALTHYLILGDRQAHSSQLMEFFTLLQGGTPEKEAAGRAFGDLQLLEGRFAGYVRLMSFDHWQVPVKQGTKESQYSTAALPPAEQLALRGILFLQLDRLPEAKTAMESALRLDPRSAKANEAMGLLSRRLQDYGLARKFFEQAANLDSGRFVAQYRAARSVLEQSRRDDLGLAEKYLRKSLAIQRQFAPALELLSQLLVQEESKGAEALEMAREAAEIEPGEWRYQLNLGRILAGLNQLDEAFRVGEELLGSASSEPERRQAEALLSGIRDRRNAVLREKSRTEEQRNWIAKAQEQRQKAGEAEAPSPEVGADRKNAPPAPSPAKPGNLAKTGGIIRSVRCEDPAIMDVVLDSDGKLQVLRAVNYYNVAYGALDGPPKSEFQPCEELQGKRVQIEFTTVTGQNYAGSIKTILIEK